MAPLPRGTCQACGGDVALRMDGSIRLHRVYLPQRDQDPSTPLGRTRVCEGSDLPALDDPGARLQGRVVARLLVAAIAAILGVDDHVEAELFRGYSGLIDRRRSRRLDPILTVETVRAAHEAALDEDDADGASLREEVRP